KPGYAMWYRRKQVKRSARPWFSLILMSLVVWPVTDVAHAQRCNMNCPGGARDARGCCLPPTDPPREPTKRSPQTPKPSPPREQPLNQVYSLSMLGTQIVAGTQGGAVVWDPGSSKPVAIHKGTICRGMTQRRAVWLGCGSTVLRWDGFDFTVIP